MTQGTLDAAVQWTGTLPVNAQGHKLDVVFHGGEPLLAGIDFYRWTLPRLRETFAHRRLRLSIQSNLWLLTEEFCELFSEYNVSIGTSLDGPEAITDAQRGAGYFRRTMTGIELLRRRGLGVSCICTFTRQSAIRAGEILDFFASEGLDFSIHGAVTPIQMDTTRRTTDGPGFRQNGPKADDWSLSPEAYGELLAHLLDLYSANLNRVRISTLDALCQNISTGEGRICTFRNCLGHYLAAAPDGGIYPCQRFAGQPVFRIGKVQDNPGLEQLEQSPVWRRFRKREERMAEECGDCPHFSYCKGGCPYNALAAGGGAFSSLRDPYCSAYQRIFSTITDRALEEVFSEENLNELTANPGDGTLLRRGNLLTLLRNDTHPRDITQRAKQILAAVALGSNDPLNEVAVRLSQTGLALSPLRAEQALASLAQRLTTKGRLNNLYLHVTLACNLRCAHCYAQAGPAHVYDKVMPVKQVVSLCREAVVSGFRQVVITGGEPLIHSDHKRLLDSLAALRAEVELLLIMLRTNLALPLRPDLLAHIGSCVDKIAVSVDGDQTSHNMRRGSGTYERTVANLRVLIKAGCEADILLSANLSVKEAAGAKGESVRALARDLGIRRVHFRPILPLGRARKWKMEIVREAHWTYLGVDDAIAYGFSPTASCGIGQNLYVEPTGEAFPCYACCGDNWLLGNVFDKGGLRSILDSSVFQTLSGRTVDTNQECRHCALRYLCGGACRAWNGPLDIDLDAPPVDCRPLHARARALLLGAMDYLGVTYRQWVDAGLPDDKKSLFSISAENGWR